MLKVYSPKYTVGGGVCTPVLSCQPSAEGSSWSAAGTHSELNPRTSETHKKIKEDSYPACESMYILNNLVNSSLSLSLDDPYSWSNVEKAWLLDEPDRLRCQRMRTSLGAGRSSSMCACQCIRGLLDPGLCVLALTLKERASERIRN